ncbi:diguanylate cyclase [Bacillus timonensis]|nr:diguanylate cyclase [Bacillus timonensis]
MLLDLLNNLAIMSALLFIAGTFFQNRPLLHQAPIKTRLYAGLGSGLLGSLLMMNAIHINETMIIDLRHLAVVIAAIFGGPVSAILSATLIGIFRITFFGISTAAVTAATVSIIMGFVLGLISSLNLTKVLKYITMNVLHVTISSTFIYFLINNPPVAIDVLSHFIFISAVGGIFTYYLAEYIDRSNQNHRSTAYYKIMADNATDLISTHKLDGSFKYLSPSSLTILGYEPKELVGKNPYDYYHPDDLTAIYESHEAVKDKDEEDIVEYRFKRKDGEYIWLETASKKMKGSSDSDEEIICSSRNITVRKQLEEKLSKMNQQLNKLSNIDGLTGIANRRHFDHMYDLEWKDALTQQKPLSLLMIDIDHFKIYNDTYGHQSGDECIHTVAKISEAVLKGPRDFAARYGGEEFAVILPHTNEAEAQQIADEIRQRIYELAIPHQNSKVVPVVTISVGVSTLIPNFDINPAELIKQADLALYHAKSSGRHQVTVFEPSQAVLA